MKIKLREAMIILNKMMIFKETDFKYSISSLSTQQKLIFHQLILELLILANVVKDNLL